MSTQIIDQRSLRLSAQVSFLGRIYPEMRLVKIKAVGTTIFVNVVVERAPSSRIRDEVSLAGTEIIADFPQADRIEELFSVTDAALPREDVLIEGWIYQRAES